MYREKIKDIFFDLDHTLWDFEKNSALTFEKILAENQVQIETAEFMKTYAPINMALWKMYREERIGKNDLRYQRLKKTFRALKYPVKKDLIYHLSDQYIEHLASFNHLLPHTQDILEYLKPNYRMHIITNGFQEVQERKMRKSNIFDYFEHMINSEMAGVKKPNPWIFQLALKRTGANPGQSMMIGDNLEADILGAKALGFNTLHLNVHNDPLHEHGDMIHSLSEIKSYL
ncbi:YjjG family noncanonical pyrimidine nucleotidase [Zeaxanthinibacter sp. PT1]|uniref:YjjG family noncanonical pyrimidine nucleotidase n=1 Tax=Zeaxanthinibacter TaxID=561554 RepID=UPI00234A8382|nr:YjjG family noncanonical pyrimidine nucleotidase [Zeaxanthinibacter sp. PT1]MDC6352650.1 YjjG family noncanonical pyrimidine nucleotidase [Zeaxanthinibacter sp. PT1]